MEEKEIKDLKDSKETINTISSSELFKQFRREEILAVISSATIKKFKKSQSIFVLNEICSSPYLILEGLVYGFKLDGTRKVVLRSLNMGEAIGIESLVSLELNLSFIAKSDTTVLVLDIKTLKQDSRFLQNALRVALKNLNLVENEHLSLQKSVQKKIKKTTDEKF